MILLNTLQHILFPVMHAAVRALIILFWLLYTKPFVTVFMSDGTPEEWWISD